jgi:hypothetical protein
MPDKLCPLGMTLPYYTYDPLKQEIVCIPAPDGSYDDTLRPALNKQHVRQRYRQRWVLRLCDRK